MHGTLAGPGEAVLDLLDLFGGVNVDGAAVSERQQCGQLIRRDGAQAVRRDAEIGASQRADRLAGVRQQSRKLIDITDEAPLAVMRRCAAEAAMRVEARQQGQADAGCLGCRGDAHRHLGDIGVRRPVAIVMQIVEFADPRKTALEHLDIEQGRDRLDVLRAHRQGEAVHRLAPRPERIGGMAADLGKAGHAPLERMAVQAGDAGDRDLMLLVIGGRRHAFGD